MRVMARTGSADPRIIVRRAAAGDEVAFGHLVAAHHEDMRRICAFVVRDEGIAEEAVQLAWSIVWRRLGSLRDPTRLKPWLMRVAINEAKHLLRSQRRRQDVEVLSQAVAGPRDVDPATGVDIIDLRVAISRLA